MKSFYFLISLFCFFLILEFASCSKKSSEEPILFSGNEMTIDYRILIGHSLNTSDKQHVLEIIRDTFDEVNLVYNKWNPESELSRLNRLEEGIQVPISQELEKLLFLTDQIVTLTEGRFDPTIEPLQALWKKYLNQGKVPPLNEIRLIERAIGWNKIHFGQGYFYKDTSATSLDLGGIAKGYCIDLLTERLNQKGFKNVYVEWGGEIRATGEHPSKRPWTVFISHLGNPDPQKAIAILSLHDQAIATSGDYLQNWIVENEEGEKISYYHIIDPRTFYPLKMAAQKIASASIVASTCAFADGLATAAMMFPSVSLAQDWLNQLKGRYPDIAFWIIARE